MSYLELNSELIEKFGELEQLCNQIYDEPHGVTQYINQMDELESVGRAKVSSWDSIYRALKTVRHKRNQLSHGEVSFSESCAEQDDIDFIMAFRKKVLNCTDPISLALNKAKKSNRRASSDSKGCSSEVIKGFMYIIVFIALIAGIIAAAVSLTRGNNYNANELKSGFYYLSKSDENGRVPYLRLDTESCEFQMGESTTLSYSTGGNYTIEDDKLIAVTVDNERYVFEIRNFKKLVLVTTEEGNVILNFPRGSRFIYKD